MTYVFEDGPPITGPIFYIPGPGPVYPEGRGGVFNLTEPPRRQVEVKDLPKVLRDNVAIRTRVLSHRSPAS